MEEVVATRLPPEEVKVDLSSSDDSKKKKKRRHRKSDKSQKSSDFETVEIEKIQIEESLHNQSIPQIISIDGEDRCFPIVPSPHSPDDIHYENHVTYTLGLAMAPPETLPKKLDLRDKLGPVRDQGRRGTCVAFACCAMKERQEYIDQNYQGYFAPDSIYFYRSNKPGEGMNVKEALEIIKTKGVCRQELLPYGKKDVDAIPPEAVSDALNNKIESYARVATIDGMKRALVDTGVLVCAFPVYSSRPKFWKSLPGEKPIGGHAVATVGWNSEGFILRNSWGMWHGDGYITLPYSDVGCAWEYWACIDQITGPKYKSPPLNEKVDRECKKFWPTCWKSCTKKSDE